MGFSKERVDELVAEAQSVDQQVRQAEEYVSAAKRYAETGYAAESRARIEPEVALACYDIDELEESVDDLYFKPDSVGNMLIRRRLRYARRAENPEKKSRYINRQVQKYDELRSNAKQNLKILRKQADKLESYINTDVAPDDTGADWTLETILDHVGDRHLDSFEDRDDMETYVQEQLVED